jgi:hypothetical protein
MILLACGVRECLKKFAENGAETPIFRLSRRLAWAGFAAAASSPWAGHTYSGVVLHR